MAARRNSVTLGGSAASGSSGITIGTTTITSGTDTRVLFDDAGVIGESAGLTYTKGTTTLNVSTIKSLAGANLAESATAPAATTGASQAGKAVTITASDAVASTDTAGAAAGGSVTVTAGNAARNTSGNANGGNISLVPGTGIGTGTAGQVLVGDGVVAAPGIAFTSQTNSGLYRAGSSDVRLATNGTDRIGFTSTINFLVAVTGNGTTTSLGAGVLRNFSDRTSATNVPATFSYNILTNAGAGAGITCTLPTAAQGLQYDFIDNNSGANRLTVVVNTSDQIYWTDGTVISAATGSVVSTARYNSFSCVAVDATTWVVTRATGTWTLTP